MACGAAGMVQGGVVCGAGPLTDRGAAWSQHAEEDGGRCTMSHTRGTSPPATVWRTDTRSSRSRHRALPDATPQPSRRRRLGADRGHRQSGRPPCALRRQRAGSERRHRPHPHPRLEAAEGRAGLRAGWGHVRWLLFSTRHRCLTVGYCYRRRWLPLAAVDLPREPLTQK